jgi:hypothetical protein
MPEQISNIEHARQLVAAALKHGSTLTTYELRDLRDARRASADLHDARNTARDAGWNAVRNTERSADWVALQGAPRVVARDVARALIVRDLISQEQYDLLTVLWRTVVGRIHPDDADLFVGVRVDAL